MQSSFLWEKVIFETDCIWFWFWFLFASNRKRCVSSYCSQPMIVAQKEWLDTTMKKDDERSNKNFFPRCKFRCLPFPSLFFVLFVKLDCSTFWKDTFDCIQKNVTSLHCAFKECKWVYFLLRNLIDRK